MNLYRDLPPGRGAPKQINVVVEVPSGGVNKIEYNEKEGYFRLDRALYSAVYYPYEYGFIPQTESEDGDALDVILLATNPTFSGCVVRARPIGMLRMADERGEDNKIIAVPAAAVDPRFKKATSLSKIGAHMRDEIRQFILDYKKLEKKKYVRFKGWGTKEEAKRAIAKAIKKFQEGQ